MGGLTNGRRGGSSYRAGAAAKHTQTATDYVADASLLAELERRRPALVPGVGFGVLADIPGLLAVGLRTTISEAQALRLARCGSLGSAVVLFSLFAAGVGHHRE